MESVISCQNITKTYSTGSIAVEVLKGLDIEIKKGEFVAIMGPSGSGKSTLMNILGCLDWATSGTYRLSGKDVSELGQNQLAEIRGKKIGFIFQSFHLLPKTVLQNVGMPLIYDSSIAVHDRSKMVQEALTSAGLQEERWGHKPSELSGGERQRVAVARALVNDPDIILADEPTGNLDSKTGEHVLETFKKINREDGRTIIMITHEKEVAEKADRIINIRDGLVT